MDRTEAYEQVKKVLEFYAGATAITVSRTEISGNVGSTLSTTRDGTQAAKALALLPALKPPAPNEGLPNSYEEAKALGWNCSPLTWEAVRESVRKAQQSAHGAKVERVARALAAEDYRQRQRGDYNDAETYASRHWGEYQPEARIAIAAFQYAATGE
ncbi:hypothetical protein GobsT_50300 [Gemmata obscuriglobus]|uniref:hypothetical protein n=1 Tax=Gemmata obscuriglobus TaxID=114 RepID=UPI0011CD2FAF|nr:hypothetical protein [Gemmata obscuriglobus]QEG30227.1 hypothetical protein GobsT_50300 [Gemmata obscuriglobus]VTS09551.1 unnamed protein product [Gemmata obscuriglobus UQM 2246]